MAKLHWKMTKTLYGWRGELTLPSNLPGGLPGFSAPGQAAGLVAPGSQALKVTSAPAASKASALSQAAGLASSVLGNPILAAAFPPGTGTAVKAVAKLADAAGAGKLASAATKLVGDGAKRLASALKFW